MKGKTYPAVVLVWLVFLAALSAQTTASSVSYSLSDRGAITFQTLGGAAALIGGYAKVQPASGTTAPAAVALLGLRQNEVLVSETGVPGAQAIFNGTAYAEVSGSVNTGIALANPNSAASTVSFTVKDAVTGLTIRQSSFTLAANAQTAAFLNQSPFNATGAYTGAIEFDFSLPVAVIALRTTINSRGDFLLTTERVATGPPSSTPVVLAEFADGGGWQTRLQLVNATDFAITGSVQFFSQGSATAPGGPLGITVNGLFNTTFNYSIPARSSASLQTAGVAAATQTGSIRITPGSATSAPSAFAVLSYSRNGVVVTEASVQGEPTGTAFRMYAEASRTTGQPSSLQSAVALTNTSTTAATVNFELRNLDGSATSFTALRTIPASGQIAQFLRELFPALPDTFTGVLRITSGTTPLAAAGLHTRLNERGDFLITTTPASDETRPAASGELVFPQIVDQAGYSTQFVLFSGVTGQSVNGAVRFFSQTGQPLSLTIQ